MSKPFDWMSHLGFEVQDAGGVPVINEEGDMREADLCHRVLWDEMVSLKARRDELLSSAKAVIEHREGDLPIRGWLRDNDASRSAISALAAAIDKVEKPAIKHVPADDTEGGAL